MKDEQNINLMNATITSTYLGYYDKDILTFTLSLGYDDNSGQSIGLYTLNILDKASKKRVGHPHGIDLISKILDTVGVNCWESLIGKRIRVKQNKRKVYAIGNLLEDNWLNLDDFFKQSKEK